MNTDRTVPTLDRTRWIAQPFIIGVAALVIAIVGGIFFPEDFFGSYLVAFMYWFSLSLGCLVILMLSHITGGKWGLVIRRILEAACRTLPLMALAFIPVALGMPYLYEWANPDMVEKSVWLQHVQGFLNIPMVIGKTIINFAIWIAISYFLNRWSWALDEDYTHKRARRLRLLSGPGLVLYGVTITLASVDWLMSMQPGWYSSIFGVLIAVSQIVPAFAFAILVLLLVAPQPPLADFMDDTTWRDLGNLLLAFLMFWAYMAFSQFFLIWCGNLPEETVWYLRRGQHGWEWVGAAIALFFFVVPFFALFNADVKTDRRKMFWVLGIILVMSYVNYYWMIVPSLGFYPHPSFAGPDAHVPTRPLGMSWLDPLTFVGLGGLWIACYCWCLAARPLLPVHHPILQEVPQHG